MAYSSFIFSTGSNSIVWRCPILLTHSPAEQHLGWLHVLAVMKKAAVYICAQRENMTGPRKNLDLNQTSKHNIILNPYNAEQRVPRLLG